MADALIDVYLAVKMRDVTSAALYSIASGVDGMVITKAANNRSQRAIGNGGKKGCLPFLACWNKSVR